MVPAEMVSAEELDVVSQSSGYGLLWVYDSSSIKLKRESEPRDSCEGDEIRMLVSALRRVRTREFLTIISEDLDG